MMDTERLKELVIQIDERAVVPFMLINAFTRFSSSTEILNTNGLKFGYNLGSLFD